MNYENLLKKVGLESNDSKMECNKIASQYAEMLGDFCKIKFAENPENMFWNELEGHMCSLSNHLGQEILGNVGENAGPAC